MIHLTRREKECLTWEAAGKTAEVTAQLIGISEHTVVFHRKNAVLKFGGCKLITAVAMAIAAG